MPPGIQADFAGEGEWDITLDVFRDLGLAFGAAMLMIYIILVAQTKSFLIPLIVMLAIPLTVLGVMPGFWLLNVVAGQTVGGYADPVYFTATAMIGMIALAGIVTRDSIILVDFIRLAVGRGRPLFDAIMESRVVRLRPILLTAGAATLASLPITLDPIFSGLGWSIIFGLIASTDATYGGVAPGANLVALKVARTSDGEISGQSVYDALNWVLNHRQQYNITAINLSLGFSDQELTRADVDPQADFEPALAALKSAGVFISVAAGNDSYLHGQNYPAVSPNVVSVGATWVSDDWSMYIVGGTDDPYPQYDQYGVLHPARDYDYGPLRNNIAWFSNRYDTPGQGATSLMAPGVELTSSVPLAMATISPPASPTSTVWVSKTFWKRNCHHSRQSWPLKGPYSCPAVLVQVMGSKLWMTSSSRRG